MNTAPRNTDGTSVVNLTVAENSRRQVEGDIVYFGVEAGPVIASRTKGMRIIVLGSCRSRA